MRVGLISSFPPSKDGLAVYTYKLCKAMISVDKDVEILVVANTDKSSVSIDRIKVVKALSNNLFLYPFKVLQIFTRQRPDIIHCQHEFWLYGRGIFSITFILLLLFLRTLRKPIIITIHGIVARNSLTSISKHFTLLKMFYLIFLMKTIETLSSKVIVHLKLIKHVLVHDYGYKRDKVELIPHGSDALNLSVNKFEAREKLGLPKNCTLLLCFGEIRRGKGLHLAIEAMVGVIKKLPSSLLLIAGGYFPESSPESKGYLNELKEKITSLNLEKNVFIRARFVPEEYVDLLFIASDAVLLPYVDTDVIRAPGPFYRAMSYFKPTIASISEMFKDVTRDGELGFLVDPTDARKFGEAIVSIVSRSDLKSRISGKLKEALAIHKWENIAIKTLKLFSQTIAEEA